MADNYTHRLNATNALMIAGYRPRYQNAFVMGANGPDLFFYHQMYNVFGKNKLYSLGSDMHKHKTGLFLKTLFSMAKTDVQKDYCLGFLCHYSLDSLIHPFVGYLSTAYASPFNIPHGHSFYESALDSKLSAELYGTRTADNKYSVPEIKEFELNQITYLLRNAVAEVYPEYSFITQDDCEQAIKDTTLIKQLFVSPSKIGHLIAGRLEKTPLFEEGLITSHMQPCEMEVTDFPVWQNLENGIYSVETIDEILKRADYKSADLILRGLHYFQGAITLDELGRTVGSQSYDTGLTVE